MDQLELKWFWDGFTALVSAPGGVARARELILSLAVQGRLVPQDVFDEPASQLLKRIAAEKNALLNKATSAKARRSRRLALMKRRSSYPKVGRGRDWEKSSNTTQAPNMNQTILLRALGFWN